MALLMWRITQFAVPASPAEELGSHDSPWAGALGQGLLRLTGVYMKLPKQPPACHSTSLSNCLQAPHSLVHPVGAAARAPVV